MTFVEAVAATAGGLTNGEIAAIITAALVGITGLFALLVKIVVARRPVELAEVRRETKRDADESMKFRTQHALAESFIETIESQLEHEKESHERTRGALTQKVQSEAALMAENVELRRTIIDMRDEIDECKAEIETLKTEVRECHQGRVSEAEDRAADMQGLVLWMTGELARVGIKSEPPRLRSITPRDMPAISSSSADKSAK
jgi:hypothetical protein